MITLTATATYSQEQIDFFATKKGWRETIANWQVNEETGVNELVETPNPISSSQFCVDYFKNLLTNEIISGAVEEIVRQGQLAQEAQINQVKDLLAQAINVTVE